MEHVKSFFRRDRMAAELGMTLAEVTPGGAVATMTVEDRHLNGMGMAHGGAIFTLADFAFAAACNSHGTVAVALNVSISYVKAAGKGAALTATAEETSRGRRTGTYAIRVADEQDRTVALFHGLAYRKDEQIDWGA